MARWTLALLTAVSLAVAAIGCGDTDSTTSGDVPPGVAATIGDVEIGTDDVDEQVDVLARAQRSDGGSSGDVSAQERDRLRSQALSMLLTREALEQEAADRGITVTLAEARERWEAVARDQFKTERALRRFLGGQAKRDVLAQLRLQMLTERIQRQVGDEAGGGKTAAELQKDFQRRWRDRTACSRDYAAPGCG